MRSAATLGVSSAISTGRTADRRAMDEFRDQDAAGSSASGQGGTGSVNDDEIIDAEIVDEK